MFSFAANKQKLIGPFLCQHSSFFKFHEVFQVNGRLKRRQYIPIYSTPNMVSSSAYKMAMAKAAAISNSVVMTEPTQKAIV